MLRQIWIVLGLVALVMSAYPARFAASDKHPTADIDPAVGDVAQNGHANLGTDGIFAPAVSYPVGHIPTSVAVDDFNQDGWPDIVTGNKNFEGPAPPPEDVTVLLGHGDGTFAPSVSYATGGHGAGPVAVGDLDQDGLPDVVTVHGRYAVDVLLGNGDGSFALPRRVLVEDPPQDFGGSITDIAIDDFNQDGLPDIVTALYSAGTVAVLLGNGNGSFSLPASFPVVTRNCFRGCNDPTSVAVGDFDRDGQRDLVTTVTNADAGGALPGKVRVLLGHGDGSFGAADGFGGPSQDYPMDITVGDFDQDGRQDLVTANRNSHNVTVLLGLGDGSFAAGVSYSLPSPYRYGSPVSVAVGDIDKDGWPDLVTANRDSDRVTLMLGWGDGTFAPGVNYLVGDGPFSVAIDDFDEDGWPDVVTANFLSDDVSVLINRPLVRICIDIKPDGYPNSVNPYARGVLPVAILGSDTFDVADIDVDTLAFGPYGASIAHRHGHLQDVNFDGLMDLITHFRTRDTGIVCGDEAATVTGETLEGQPIEGTDSIQTVGCRASRWPAIWMRDEERVAQPSGDGVVRIERN